MPNQRRPLFDSSFAALVLLDARHRPERVTTAQAAGRTPRFTGGGVTGMSIQFAPEPDPTAHVVDLGEDQTTGALPLGFEFEFFGVWYTWFDLSWDGFMTFGSHRPLCRSDDDPRSRFIPLNTDLKNFIALGWTDVCPRGRRHVAYEVRGAPQRRRLVLSLGRVPAPSEAGLRTMTAQLVLYERTGMIDVYTTRRDAVASRFKEEAIRFSTA